ncbi:MAG: hypothetical protein L3J11_03845 [Draconibacterium sp.]|nr:hypothetical protein [Draconibacterium sp.]
MKKEIYLEKDEKEIMESYGKGEWESVKKVKEKIDFYKGIAKNTLGKDKRINIRISNRDLLEIKRKAVVEGIPYQTLIYSILHKYINGSLIEKAI